MLQAELFENEKIKQIEGYPKYYITTFGRVWSENTHKWLKPTINSANYHNREYVSLGRKNKFYVHQLVAKAFIPNPNNLPEIDHIDTNGLNNHVDNLRWVTHTQNMNNPTTKEHIKKNTGYLIEIEEIKTGLLFYGLKETAEYFNVCEMTILNHLNNKVKNPRWRRTGKRVKESLNKVSENSN